MPSAEQVEDERGQKDRPSAVPPSREGTRARIAIGTSSVRVAGADGDLARTEEEVARVHDQIAASRSSNSDHYRLTAAEARKAASRAREIERRVQRPISSTCRIVAALPTMTL